MAKKTYLDELDPTPILGLLRFFQESKFSPMVHSMRYAILAMYGDRAAEAEAHQYLDKMLIEFPSNSIFNTLNNRMKNQESSDRVYPYLQQYNAEGVPFSDFSHDPAPISQIKKIINALYHAEEALKRIETLNLDEMSRFDSQNTITTVLSEFWGPITDDIYDFCMLMTHTDMDLVSTFGPEWTNVSGVMNQLLSKFSVLFKDTNQFLSAEYEVDITSPVGVVHQVGAITGKGLAYLRPTNNLDYSTVSYFSANLSSYLNAMTQSIHAFAAKHLADASYQNKDERALLNYQIFPKKIHELDLAAVKLATSFEGLFAGGMVSILNQAKLPFMIRDVSLLVMSIINEAINLQSGTEDLIKALLSELKYKVCLEMIVAIDKIEEEMMLRPGVLSGPMMDELASFYDALYAVVGGFVDLSASGQDLVKLEESRLVEKRLHFCFERQAAREVRQAQHKIKEQAIDAFFALLLPHQEKRLSELDSNLKKELLKCLKVIRDDLEEISLPEFNMMIRSLNFEDQKNQTWVDYFYEQINDVSGNVLQSWLGDYPDRIGKICHRYNFELTSALELNPEDFDHAGTPVAGLIYLKSIQQKIAYSVKMRNGSVVKNELTPLDAPVPFTLSALQAMQEDILDIAFKNNHIVPDLNVQLKHRLNKQKATYAFQTILNQDLISHIHETLDTLLQHPHDIKQDALRVDESAVIRTEDNKILHKKMKKDKQQLNLDELTRDEALSLYQTYTINQNKLAYAQHSLHEFMKQLEHENTSTLLSSVERRNRLRNLYTIFQPAMVTAMVEVMGVDRASDFDKAMIAALSGSDNRIKNPLTIGHLHQVYHQIHAHLVIEKDNAASRIMAIEAAIKQKITTADESFEFILDKKNELRASYLVRKPQYEIFMNKLQGRVDDLIKQLSPMMQQGLKIEDRTISDALLGSVVKKMDDHIRWAFNLQKTLVSQEKITPEAALLSYFVTLESRSLPFPEVEALSSMDYLKQPRQLILFKQLINCLHHLKETSIQLELLADDQYKIEYVWRVIMIEEHIRSTTNLLFEISQDPYFTPIIGEFLELFQSANETFQTFKKPYTPEKFDQDSHVETHDVVFFIVNSLMISTRQIEQLQAGKLISDESAQKVQQFAENYSADLARIIASSDSNLSMILELPTMAALFTKIKNRWNNFSIALNQSINVNLESINTEIFSDILIEADAWEFKLGVNPGLITSPLKQILDAYYYGLIISLGHDDWHKIDLATSSVTFQKRITHIKQKIADVEEEKINLSKKQDILTQFIQLWKSDQNACKRMLAEPKDAPIEMTHILDAFRTLLQDKDLLKKCESFFHLVSEKYRFEDGIIALLSDERWANEPFSDEQLEHVYQGFLDVAQICVAYHEGLMSTSQYALDHLLAQKKSVQTQKALQKAVDKKFEEDYIKKAINKELENHQSAAKNLLYGGHLYDDALLHELDKKSASFIQKAVRSKSLEEQVKAFVLECVREFDKDHFEEYHQYDALNKTVAELRAYIAKQTNELARLEHTVNKYTWSFENALTLANKNKLLKELESILNDKEYSLNGTLIQFESIKQRIEVFTKKVTSPIFENGLLQYQKYNISTFSWLVRWLVSLFQVLKLYRSEAEIVHNNLKQSAEKANQLVNPGTANGMFAAVTSESSQKETVKNQENYPKKM